MTPPIQPVLPPAAALCRIAAAVAILLGAFASTPACAERVEPPLELLYAPDNMLVAGSLIEINPAGRLVFQRKELLGGKTRPPEQIDIRVPASTLKAVRIGTRYLFAYSLLHPDPRRPTRLTINPDGGVLLTSIGLDPALFRDSREVRAILNAGRDERGRASQHLFDLLLKALAGPDAALQNLAAGQIALDPEIGERLREDGGRAIVEKSVRNPHTPPNVRVTLLVAAATNPRDFGAWWQPAAVEIVTTTPVGGYSAQASDPTDLVLTALELLDQHAAKLPPDTLKRWVWNANPSLVEKASLMLRQVSPAQERSTIQQALADPKLPENTRKFLDDHLRRLDRLDARSKAQKQGAG